MFREMAIIRPDRNELQTAPDPRLAELEAAKAELARQNEQLMASREMAEAQRRRYQELFDFAPHGYVVTDLYGLISDANLAACKMLRQSRDLLIGIPLTQLLARHDRRKALDFLVRFRQGSHHAIERVELMLHPKGAALVPCAVTINAITTENGVSEGLRWMLADVTERKEAEERLRQSDERLRAMFEKAVVGIIEVDRDGHCIDANEQLCRILGYGREELLMMTVRELTYFEDRPHSDELNKALHEGRVDSVCYDKRYLKRDGKPVWVHVTVSAVRDFQGRFQSAIATVEEIGERKDAEERIRQLNRELKQRNAELLVERERWQGVVEGIADEVWICDAQGRMSLMNLPNVTLMGLKEFSDETVDEVFEDVEIFNADGTPRARKDSPLLRSLRGEVLRGEEVMRQRQTGKIRYRQYSSAPTHDAMGAITGAVAIVRDITDFKHLEQELKTAKDAAEEANRAKDHFLAVLSHELRTPLTPVVMALAMLGDRQDLEPDLRETLEMVRRNIDLEARLIDDLLDFSEGKGKGATFRVRLPLAVPAQPSAEAAPAAPSLRVARPLHILLVEDHGVTARILQVVLAAEGHTVETAGDLATALKLADYNAFDLLISDLGLPDGSGHDLMRQLRQRGHLFPGIALSGYGQEEDVRRSHQAGFTAHLSKPASREAMVETIFSVMGGEGAKEPADASSDLPADTPVFDPQAALKECFGAQELLSQMIQFFFEDYDNLLPQIHAAQERGDLPELGKLGHRLKGTILHLGAELAEEAAADVERVGLYGGERAEAEEAVRWLERECQVLRAALTEYQTAMMATQA
jgi:two-component system, chemotaxis family, CheB/CheR fusion protein